MISEILRIGQISKQASGTPRWRTGQTRETARKAKHLQTRDGCSEKAKNGFCKGPHKRDGIPHI